MNQGTLTEQLLFWKVIWAWFEKDWPCLMICLYLFTESIDKVANSY